MKPSVTLINALANIATGFSLVFFQLVGTRIVSNTGADNLTFWALSVSLAGFAPLFAFNLNTCVARLGVGLVPHEARKWASLLCHATRLAQCYLGLAIVAGLLGAMLLPTIYPLQIGADGISRVLGVSGLFFGSCWIVLAQPFQGVLIARQQNVSIAKSTLLGRILALVLLWVSTVLSDSLPVALVFCGACLWLSYWLMRRDVPEWHERATYFAIAHEDLRFASVTGGFAVWSIASLLFQVSLVPLVGAITPGATTAVYLAVTLMAILVGLVNACTGALIVPIGRLVCEKAFARVVGLSWLVGIGLLVYSALLILLLPQILALWVGDAADVAQVRGYLMLVAGLQCVRLSGAVSSVMMIVKADNRQLAGPSLFELVGLLALAMPLGFMAGAQIMLAALIVVSCVATCATIVMAAGLNEMAARDKRVIGLLCLPLSFAVTFVTAGFLLS